jgi:uncharacterized membrane protein
MTKIHKNIIFILVIIFLSLFAIIPLFHSGFFDFHDNTQVVRVFELGKSLESGMFPVRWVQGLGYGYGYPIFNFYGPLPYYMGGIAHLIGFDALSSTKIMFGFGIVLSGITMFFLSRRFFGNWGGIVSSVIYMYFPYHAVNIYVRGAVDEFYAYAFLPIIFLGLYELMEKVPEKLLDTRYYYTFSLISLGFFLIAVSHNLSIFMLLLMLIPFFVLSIFLVKQKKNYISFLIVSVLFGVFLSSFYIFPAFFEMKYTNVLSQIGGGANYSDHFVCIQQYWNSMWGFGGSVKGCVDGLSFKLGKINLVFFASSLLLFLFTVYKKKFRIQEKTVLVSLVLFIASLFLTLQTSEFIWKSIPYMQFVQYPWRFINFVGLFLSFIAGYLVFRTRELWGKEIGVVICLVIVLLAIGVNYKLFVPQFFNGNDSSFYTNEGYIKYTVSKISDEYMPEGFEVPKAPINLPTSDIELLNSGGSVTVITKRSAEVKVKYSTKKDGVLHFNLAYFPAWKAYINNVESSIVPTSTGMNIPIQKGEGEVEVRFVQTTLEAISNIISVIFFLCLLIGIILRWKNYQKQ